MRIIGMVMLMLRGRSIPCTRSGFRSISGASAGFASEDGRGCRLRRRLRWLIGLGRHLRMGVARATDAGTASSTSRFGPGTRPRSRWWGTGLIGWVVTSVSASAAVALSALVPVSLSDLISIALTALVPVSSTVGNTGTGACAVITAANIALNAAMEIFFRFVIVHDTIGRARRPTCHLTAIVHVHIIASTVDGTGSVGRIRCIESTGTVLIVVAILRRRRRILLSITAAASRAVHTAVDGGISTRSGVVIDVMVVIFHEGRIRYGGRGINAIFVISGHGSVIVFERIDGRVEWPISVMYAIIGVSFIGYQAIFISRWQEFFGRLFHAVDVAVVHVSCIVAVVAAPVVEVVVTTNSTHPTAVVNIPPGGISTAIDGRSHCTGSKLRRLQHRRGHRRLILMRRR
mmetsp:Transcript_3441/g.7337  ORF Transcript_3441/g.7337 Transcript_3441/m.7337 type:complete len:403 (+) Transcript_3441:4310-5518(+)